MTNSPINDDFETFGMVDISNKRVVNRTAVAEGTIHLNHISLNAIKTGKNPKGDVLENAKLAAIHAVKKTPDLVFMAHPIQVNSVKVQFKINDETITTTVTVKGKDRTGVEIEAIAGVMNCLLAIFDLSKRYEKDEKGQYRKVRITDIFVVNKIKEE